MASRSRFPAPPASDKLERLGANLYQPGRTQDRGGQTFTVSFSLDADSDHKLSELAAARGVSRSKIIRELILAEALRR